MDSKQGGENNVGALLVTASTTAIHQDVPNVAAGKGEMRRSLVTASSSSSSQLPLYHHHHDGTHGAPRASKRIKARQFLCYSRLHHKHGKKRLAIVACSLFMMMVLCVIVRLETTITPPVALPRPVSNHSLYMQLNLTQQVPARHEVDQINKYLSTMMTVDDILRWAFAQFGKGLVDVTSFGPSGLVILHKLGTTLGLLEHVPIVTIDTLHLFPETYDYIHQLQQSSSTLFGDDNVTIHIYKPFDYDTQQEFDDALGKDLWRTDPEKYAYFSKVEPTLRALDDTNAVAWITGRRQSQGGQRSNLEVLEVDIVDAVDHHGRPRYKINPLAHHWSYSDVWEYIHKKNIPYNPLHDKGYKSIGDYMSTVPIAEDKAERDGRFVGVPLTPNDESTYGGSAIGHGRSERITECGIHATRAKMERMKQRAQGTTIQNDVGGASLPLVPLLSCGVNCINVTARTFDNLVLNNGENKGMLIEFYSPMCGACQAFAPKFERIATELEPFASNFQLARFDITEEDVPESGQDAGFDVKWTPSLFLVRRDPFGVTTYDGDLEAKAVLKWIQREVDYINLY